MIIFHLWGSPSSFDYADTDNDFRQLIAADSDFRRLIDIDKYSIFFEISLIAIDKSLFVSIIANRENLGF